VPTATDPTGIRGVNLADRVTLAPEAEQIVVGYILKAHVESSTFTIEARPLKVGETGAFSFFREQGGVVRLEPGFGKSATEESRPWSQPLAEDEPPKRNP